MSPRRTAALRATPPPEPVVAPDPVAPVLEQLIEAAPSRRPGAAGVWLGIGVVAVGLALVVLAWGLVASAEEVRDQVAPLIVGGIGGLAVVVLGLSVVHVAVGRRDEDEHRRQLAALGEVLAELRAELGR